MEEEGIAVVLVLVVDVGSVWCCFSGVVCWEDVLNAG